MGSSSDIKTIGILQPGYLPWLGFFEQLYRCDVFVLYDDVQFEKGSWRNRNRIKTPEGPQWLTVPVVLKGAGLPMIRDVKINSSVPWYKKHIKAIKQNYSRSPFLDCYADSLFEILGRSWKFLIDLDLELIVWLSRELGIRTPIMLSSDLGIPGANVQRLVDIIHALGGTHFYEGSAGRNYIETEFFANAGISITFQDYQHPNYQQLYKDFVPNLSVIDLLFNCGSESLKILTGA